MKKIQISIRSTDINPFSVYVSDTIKIRNGIYKAGHEYKFIYEHIYEIAKFFLDNLPNYKVDFWFDGKPITEMSMEQSYHDYYNEEELGI